MHFLPTGNKLLTTFFGKAANTGVSERRPHTLSVTPTIALATETEKVVSETCKEMNIEFGKRIGEMVVSETSSLSSSLSAHAAHAATAIPVEEIFCDSKMQHMQHATEARENIKKCYCYQRCQKSNRCPHLPQQYLIF